jgi:hypothetical protein
MQFDPTENFLTKTNVSGNLDDLEDSLKQILQYAWWPALPAIPSELKTISINLKRTSSTPHAEKWGGLSGRIVDENNGTRWTEQREYTIWNEEVPKYIRKLVKRLEKTYDFQSGRVRLSNLRPLQCLRSHADNEQRFHLAIRTNPGVFFYNITVQQPNSQYSSVADLENFSGVGYHIPADGFFYKSNTLLPHTAVNTGKGDRIHLVVDICPSYQV